jgi:hypothetical protein
MCELVGEVLRRNRVLDECVRNAFGGRARYIEGYDCGCEGSECLLAFGRETGF